jgi:hypothetical protein
MRVKIGNKLYNPEEEPIMIILSDIDRYNISMMPGDAKKYCVFPDDIEYEDIKEWMKTEEELGK